MYKGIDVSEHNGFIDWDKVKDQIEFAILRIGWIGNKNNHTIDKHFERNYYACRRLGIPIGIYVYNYCNSIETAESGANWVADILADKDIDLPVYIDMEDKSLLGFSKDALTSIACKFNYTLEQYGYWVGVYANKDWYENHLDKEVIKRRFTTWIAHYGVNENKYQNEYDMLQYKVDKKGSIQGIDGEIDLNIMYRDLINEINKYYSKEPESFIKKSIDEIVQEVIDGKWGNGEDRKINLENSGYNYKEIQNKVNEKLKPQVKYLSYIVKSGDSLSKIAKKYNTNWKEIYELNKAKIGSNPNFIRVGMLLKIKI